MSQIALTNRERTDAIMRFGYTDREASFLCLVALHSGYFLRRQYCQFIGKEVGGTAAALIEKIAAKNHATAVAGCQNAYVYHVSARPFYAMLGQEDNRNRRKRPPVVIKNRLMGLDFVLDHPSHHYLATEQEKVAYFTQTLGISCDDLPARLFRSPTARTSTARYFMDKYPLFVSGGAASVVSFCFVDEGLQTGARFESFLKEHTRLFARLNRFEVIYVYGPATPFQAAESIFRKVLQSPALAQTGPVGPADVDRLITHFEERQMYDSGALEHFDRARLIRLRDDRQTYASRFFSELYSRWQTSGRAAVQRSLAAVRLASRVLEARFSTYVLRHNYDVFGTTSKVSSN
jgi:hypothetical protein